MQFNAAAYSQRKTFKNLQRVRINTNAIYTHMTFRHLAEYFEKLETTASRLTMTEVLAALFKETQAQTIKEVTYLLQGRVVPLYVPLEFGIADKMMIRAIARATQTDEKVVLQEFKKCGDLGLAAQDLKSRDKTTTLTIAQVFVELTRVAQAGGAGSQDQKLQILSDLLQKADGLSARYIVRIPLGKLRLGFSDMTILDALSWMLIGNKKLRSTIEKAYNVRPDLGVIAQVIKEKGIEGLTEVEPEPGTPILMARAERVASAEDITLKIGPAAIEFKYDGFRLQVHKRGQKVTLYSRNLENVTHMYPDIVDATRNEIKADSVIIEGEAIAYNPKTNEFLPFQETVQRKRKYDIAEVAKKIPLRFFIFDMLYTNGENLLHQAYTKRREMLEKVVRVSQDATFIISQSQIVTHPKNIERLFETAVSDGLEGIMAKRPDGVYQAGARNWNWIKFKRSYSGSLSDTIDVLVMGFDMGQGKRADFGIGDFLVGVFDKKNDRFVTMCKIGTGLSDEEWREVEKRCQAIKTKDMPKEYDVDKAMECDVWVKPHIVVEIRADEITRSPVHTAGRIMGLTKTGGAQEVKEAGYALRFPRLERFRDDKKPADATTLDEIKHLFSLQGNQNNKGL